MLYIQNNTIINISLKIQKNNIKEIQQFVIMRGLGKQRTKRE